MGRKAKFDPDPEEQVYLSVLTEGEGDPAPEETQEEAVAFAPLDTALTVGEVVREIGPPPRKKRTPEERVTDGEKRLAYWIAKRDADHRRNQKRINYWRKELKRRIRALKK